MADVNLDIGRPCVLKFVKDQTTRTVLPAES